MKYDKQILLSIKEVAKNSGYGTLVSIYNDIEDKWYNYVGEFRPRNPSNNIHFSSIRGKCIDYIIENKHTYFMGDIAKNQLISTKIEDLPTEELEFDFKFIWFK